MCGDLPPNCDNRCNTMEDVETNILPHLITLIFLISLPYIPEVKALYKRRNFSVNLLCRRHSINEFYITIICILNMNLTTVHKT